MPVSGRASVCGSGKQQLRIELTLDDYGDENSWELRNTDSNKIIKRVDTGNYGANESDEIEMCLDDGNYRFTLFDGTGDGICCRTGQGHYKLFMDGDLMVDEQYFNTGKKSSHDIIVGYGKSLTLTTREQQYLDAHNWRRRKAHEEANTDYVALKWSKGLAKHASNWADTLLQDCDVEGIKHEPNVEQGENLAKNTGKGAWGNLYPVENIVRRWVEREEGWNWPSNAHLTQALWRSKYFVVKIVPYYIMLLLTLLFHLALTGSKYVGCAESTKTMSNGGTCHIQVCRYARAGRFSLTDNLVPHFISSHQVSYTSSLNKFKGNCNMGKYDPKLNQGWKKPMLEDGNPCGPACPPEGCF